MEAFISPKTYGPAEVAAAAGVERGTFHSWLARRYVRIASRGRGISREFSFEDAVGVAFIAELDRHGIPVGTASDALVLMRGEFDLAINDILANDNLNKVVLVTRYGSELSGSIVLHKELSKALSPIRGTEAHFPFVFIVIDLSRLVRAVRSKLGG